MSRNDEWDIVSGIGITALAVAAGRALEARRVDRLIDDPHAERLVRAANTSVPMLEPGVVDDPVWEGVVDYLAIRSVFFDEWFDAACAAGVQQAVILASGLDTRGFRKQWPPRFRLFEIDQPKVLAFKDGVLREQDARPACEHYLVPVDLRGDWATPLKGASFEPGLPTAWLAEGLLPYLPPEAETQLIDTITELSAPGSRVAVEDLRIGRAQLETMVAAQAGQDWGVDVSELLDLRERAAAATLFVERGWRVRELPSEDLGAHYGRKPTDSIGDLSTVGQMLTAELPG